MQSAEIRQKFLSFFQKRDHVFLPSASLVPEGDSTILFTTAGMQPLIPYLMGKPHPKGKRLVNIQKCVRTQDIEEVGDNTHDTFFEMLGNWSLGDFFKEDAIKWSHELLISKEEGFDLDPKRLYITVFEGDDKVSADEEAKKVWLSLGVPENRIYYKGVSDNWWPAVKGEDNWTGPTGPDTEMFYDITEDGLGDLSPEEFNKADDEQKVVEIWNDVFMQYEKKDGEIIDELKVKNVDTGAGLERLAMVLQKKDNIFDTDLFETLMPTVERLSDEVASRRIIADHIRTAVFIISDDVRPSNTERGYVLRRLIRRAMIKTKDRDLGSEEIAVLVDGVSNKYGEVYKNILEQKEVIREVIELEVEKFKKTLNDGLKQVEKGADPFTLFTSFGLPLEIIREVADVDEGKFKEQMEEHQDLSRKSAGKKFSTKGRSV